jgi:hypothetical protein
MVKRYMIKLKRSANLKDRIDLINLYNELMLGKIKVTHKMLKKIKENNNVIIKIY